MALGQEMTMKTTAIDVDRLLADVLARRDFLVEQISLLRGKLQFLEGRLEENQLVLLRCGEKCEPNS